MATEKTIAELSIQVSDIGVDVNRREEESLATDPESKTPRQWLVLLLLGFGNLLVAACMSLQAPFFPQEAEDKLLTPKEYGLLFGTYYLTVFVFSNISAKLLEYVSPKFTFISGLLVTGSCYILFGILHECPGGMTYKLLAFCIRLIEGIGSAACKTSCATIVLSEFPENIASTFAHLETYFGVGLLLGPIAGGVLYEKNGFSVLFIGFGICVLICTFFALVFLPNPECVLYGDGSKGDQTVHFWLNPTVFIQYSSVLCATMCVGYNQAALEPHLRQFSLSPVAIGLVFVVSGGVYALTSPIWGTICEMQSSPKITSAVGCILIVLSFMLIGPVKFIQIGTQLWMIVFSLFVFGLGLGAVLVSAFIDVLREATKRGFPKDLRTYALTSSVFASAVALGYFAGPSLGGYLLETVGYRDGTVFFLYAEFALLCLLCLYIVCEKNGDCDWPEWEYNKTIDESYLLGKTETYESILDFPLKTAGFQGVSIRANIVNRVNVGGERQLLLQNGQSEKSKLYGGTV